MSKERSSNKFITCFVEPPYGIIVEYDLSTKVIPDVELKVVDPHGQLIRDDTILHSDNTDDPDLTAGPTS